MEAEESKDDVVDTNYDFRGMGRHETIIPAQVREELEAFLDFLADREIQTVLEIGTASGGTLYAWARALELSESIYVINLPEETSYDGPRFGQGLSEWDMKFYSQFSDEIDFKFIPRNSHDEETKSTLENQLSGDELDLLFIDGDHQYEGVKSDFEMYSSYVRDGGIIAFHDINHPAEHIEVGEYWEEIRDDYDTMEIISGSDDQIVGEGTVPSAGIGVITV